MKKIYWASRLHTEEHCVKNIELKRSLEESIEGIEVLLPQRHGVWEEMLQQEKFKGRTLEETECNVKKYCYEQDLKDLETCDIIVLYFNEKTPGTGASFEVGYCKAKGKKGYIYAPDEYTRNSTNLMVMKAYPIFTDFGRLVEAVRREVC